MFKRKDAITKLIQSVFVEHDAFQLYLCILVDGLNSLVHKLPHARFKIKDVIESIEDWVFCLLLNIREHVQEERWLGGVGIEFLGAIVRVNRLW